MDGTVEALSELSRALDSLAELDVTALDAPDFASLLEAVEVQRRRLDSVDVALLAAADEQLVAASHCRTSTADLLIHQLRVAPDEAKARVRRARDLGPRRTLQGERLEPIHSQLAAAQRAGEISTRHIDVATRALGRIPSDIANEASHAAEWFLLEAARHENPRQMVGSATQLLARLDPDGSKPDEKKAHDRRAFGLRHRDDGSWKLDGSLTGECGLALKTMVDAVSAPSPSAGGERDTRTPEQRAHDGLRDLAIRILKSGTLPDAGGDAVSVVIKVRPQDLAAPDGLCQTSHGHVMRVGALRHLLGDAAFVPLLFDRNYSDCRLMLGRTQRLANRAQRRALKGRDGGCSFPACDRPASWCEVHHVREWTAERGPTNIDNLTLLCGFHHREFERRGWRVEMTDGLPHWIPPRWIDPDQRPRLNTVHHLPEIVFDPDGVISAVRDGTHRP